MSHLTIVMYHYVRPIEGSRYPEIKGLERSLFEQQLDYLDRWYENVTAQQVIEATRGGEPLPKNAVLLTFDDGYSDHFQTVFPLLQNRGLHGCFFPPVQCIESRRVLNVNKIHYVLASCKNKTELMRTIDAIVERSRDEFQLQALDQYKLKYAVPGRYDPPEVNYIKKMLQVALPEALRDRLVDALFREFLGVSERALADELYATKEQLRLMVRAGMTVGSHGVEHHWLDQLGVKEQEYEIDESLRFLREIGVEGDWVMCYPHGAWNEPLLDLLRRRGCAMGLTTEVDLADVSTREPLLLPRLNTNDVPKAADAPPSAWTNKILA